MDMLIQHFSWVATAVAPLHLGNFCVPCKVPVLKRLCKTPTYSEGNYMKIRRTKQEECRCDETQKKFQAILSTIWQEKDQH